MPTAQMGGYFREADGYVTAPATRDGSQHRPHGRQTNGYLPHEPGLYRGRTNWVSAMATSRSCDRLAEAHGLDQFGVERHGLRPSVAAAEERRQLHAHPRW